jgi:hypothetical protein
MKFNAKIIETGNIKSLSYIDPITGEDWADDICCQYMESEIVPLLEITQADFDILEDIISDWGL